MSEYELVQYKYIKTITVHIN